MRFSIASTLLLVACGPSDGATPQRLAEPSNVPLKCDGHTDDSGALQYAINSGEPIVLPQGICLTQGVHRDGGKVDIRAAVEGRSILKTINGSTLDILRLSNVTGKIDGVVFDQTGARGDGMGLRIVHGHGVVATNLAIVSPNNIGILFDSCLQCRLDGVNARGVGTQGAWAAAFENGAHNRVSNVNSVDAVNRTLVIELETDDEITNISALNGRAETVLFDRVSRSIGTNWVFRNLNNTGEDDAFAIIGDSRSDRISNVLAEAPGGFGFTFAALKGYGAPRYNIVRNLTVHRPGQQIMSFTDDNSPDAPFCNVVAGFVGTNANQQANGNFPAIDFFGARNNAAYGVIQSTDRRMTYAITEQDSVATAGGNAFFGRADAGRYGVSNLTARESRTFRMVVSDGRPPADLSHDMSCLPR